VRKANGDLLSLAQREPTPIPLGQKVLVITGNQARIVPDYSAALDPPPAPASDKDKAATEKPAATPVAASDVTNATAPKSGEPAAPTPDPIAAVPAPVDTRPGPQSGP
jgi:outer membrane lipoprotein SlyB